MSEVSFGAKNFDELVLELQQLSPLKIKFKDEAIEMQLLYGLIFWFNPNFLTHYTTVIGNTIYFPTRSYIKENESSAMKTLTHEMVHILDARKAGIGFFAMGYLFPQILALGVFGFPFLGWWSLAFLLFLFPWFAPFRVEYEARAYALDMLMTAPHLRESQLDRITKLFCQWDYYRMHFDEGSVKARIKYWMDAAESGKAPELTKVLLIYEMVQEG